MLHSLKRREPKKTPHYSQSLVAFVNAICFVCSEKSLSLYFKSKVSFLCLWHFFFIIQWKNPHQFYGVFLLFSLIEFFILPRGKEHKNYWSIDNSFNFTRHISFLPLQFQRVLGEEKNLLLFTITMALFELKIPPHEISVLRHNE